MKQLLLFLGFAFCFLACENTSTSLPGKEHVEGVVKSAGALYEKSIKPSAEQIHQDATEEVSKLARFEYKVVPLNASQSGQELEKTLNELGKDGWDCFAAQALFEGSHLLCKKRPDSYLRYIPRWVP